MPINYLAILVSSIVSILIGMFWYSPAGFGKMWMKLSGFTEDKLKKMHKDAKQSYIYAFLSTLVMTYILALFLNYTQTTTLSSGLLIGFLAWLGFVATVSLGTILWEGKPFKLYLLNMFYQLISILIMSGILTIWK